jgi:hypothetical protein
MNEIVIKGKLGRKPGSPSTSLRKTNVFKQLMHAKQDLALQLVESAQDNWESITGVLMGKALEGDMRAMALLLDYVIEKAPQKFQIQTTGIDISNVSMDDLMKLVVSYDSMMQAKKETILGEAIEIESQSINQAPPPSENTANTESQNIEMEKGEEVEVQTSVPEPLVASEGNLHAPQAATHEEITNE